MSHQVSPDALPLGSPEEEVFGLTGGGFNRDFTTSTD